jgi:acyl carrier protein
MPLVRSTRETVCEIVGETLGFDPLSIRDESELGKDLKAASLDLMEIALQLERHFNVEIPDADYAGLVSVGHICAYIDNLQRAKGLTEAELTRQ